MNTVKLISGILITITFLLIYVILYSLPVWLIWNSLFPSLFSLREISWWEASELVLLAVCFTSTKITLQK